MPGIVSLAARCLLPCCSLAAHVLLARVAAHVAMLAGLRDGSALYRHEVAYCLGQRQDPAAIKALTTILHDDSEHAMVRHEAGEALGAIGTPECIEPLKMHENDEVLEVAQTCQLALQRIRFFESEEGKKLVDTSPYHSVDPTPPAENKSFEELRQCFLDENAEIFDRYRAMFALRNRGGKDAVRALTDSFDSSASALLKHEVAYVLGQMQDENATERLKQVLENPRENPMVRHEAAEAMGSIASAQALALLRQVRA
jgi:deoxyhypusine monooxygenase